MPRYRRVSADRPLKIPVDTRDEIQLPLRFLSVPDCQPTAERRHGHALQFAQRRQIVESALVDRRDPITAYFPVQGAHDPVKVRSIAPAEAEAMPRYRCVSADRPGNVPVANRDETQLLFRSLQVPGC